MYRHIGEKCGLALCFLIEGIFHEYAGHQEPPRRAARALEEQAQRHHRSVAKEVVSLIEAGLEAPAKPPMLLPPLQPHGGHTLSLEEIEAAIADGRFARYRTLDEVKAYVDEMWADPDVAT